MNRPDEMLATLVDVVNGMDDDFGVGVVLTVGGAVVGGMLVPAIRWMKDQEEAMARAMPAAEPGGVPGYGLAQLFIGEREAVVRRMEEEDAVLSAVEELRAEGKLADRFDRAIARQRFPRFIHLRHAKYWSPGHRGMPDGDGMLWRGRLAHVVGWSLGNFESAP